MASLFQVGMPDTKSYSLNGQSEDTKTELYGLFTKYCTLAETKPSTEQLASKADEIAQKLFRQQFFRLCSFCIHKDEFKRYSAAQLALDGFYKIPFGGEIQCFSCGYRYDVRRHNIIDPFIGHRRNNVTCLHLQGQDKNNVPFEQSVSGTTLSHGSENQSQTTDRQIPDSPLQRPTASTTSRYATGRRDNAGIIRANHRDSRSNPSESSPVDARRNINRKVTLVDYRYELCRLQSFHHWPSNASISPTELANAGFFYMGTDDRVQCIFCRGILRCWEPDDKALAEHLRHFPQCPFLTDPQSVGNVQLGDEDEGLFSAIQARNSRVLEATNGNTMEGVVTTSPIHPDKAHISARLASFRDFPSNAFQKPEKLAEAGFFYKGHLDTVHCYFCNLTISHWKASDDPWVVHIQKSDTCGFLLISRGKAFIEDLKKKGVHKTKSRRRTGRRGKTLKVKQEDIDLYMSSRHVQAIQQDYDKDLLRKVVKKRLQELGEGFPNAESLLDAIQEFDEELDDESEEEETEENAAQPTLDQEAHTNPEEAVSGYEDIDDIDEEALRRQNEELVEESRCKVCLEEKASIVFLKCGHLVCCSSCAPALTKCPICRERILGTIRVDI